MGRSRGRLWGSRLFFEKNGEKSNADGEYGYCDYKHSDHPIDD